MLGEVDREERGVVPGQFHPARTSIQGGELDPTTDPQRRAVRPPPRPVTSFRPRPAARIPRGSNAPNGRSWRAAFQELRESLGAQGRGGAGPAGFPTAPLGPPAGFRRVARSGDPHTRPHGEFLSRAGPDRLRRGSRGGGSPCRRGSMTLAWGDHALLVAVLQLVGWRGYRRHREKLLRQPCARIRAFMTGTSVDLVLAALCVLWWESTQRSFRALGVRAYAGVSFLGRALPGRHDPRRRPLAAAIPPPRGR